MIILKLICSNKERSSNEFKEFSDSLKNKNIFIENDKEDENKINIYCDICDAETTEIVFINISSYIYKNIINDYNKKQMTEFLMDNYFFLKQNEIDEVKDLIMSVLKMENPPKDDVDISCLNKINFILNKIKQSINGDNELNVKGFITFRAKGVLNDIESIIDKVTEGYMVNKEHAELVKLMKYFAEIQECKIEKIIITINDDYTVKDSDNNDLYHSFLEAVDSPINGDIKTEDLIMSGLISNSPKQIEIHNKENCKNEEFLNMIEKVFEDKITYIND